jgi:hypothetical protein
MDIKGALTPWEFCHRFATLGGDDGETAVARQ